jgi:conjugal transfer pilus assembly protein TraW
MDTPEPDHRPRLQGVLMLFSLNNAPAWVRRGVGIRVAFVLLGLVVAVPSLILAASLRSEGDLGVIGPVYPIKEVDFLEYIKERLVEMRKSGELRRLQEREAAIARKRIERPRPVSDITRTVKPRVFHVDPTLTLDHAIRDARGRILYMPGTKVNPLDYLAMSKHLLFINADDKDQIKWAASMDQRYHGRVKPILVAGAPIELMKQWKRRVYFDQQGVLTRRLHIRHVPAIVSQDGRRLRVAEVLP